MIYSRVENKYLLNLSQYIYIKKKIEMLYESDSYAIEDDAYPVFTQYLETKNRKFFFDHDNGSLDRQKIRVRTYSTDFNFQKNYFLEKKEKRGRLQRKQRLAFASYDEALAGVGALIPSANVYYERRAYNCDLSCKAIMRCNFDSNILGLFPSEEKVDKGLLLSRRLIPHNYVLFEVKHQGDQVPSFVNKLIIKTNAIRISFSKYARAMSFLHEYKRV